MFKLSIELYICIIFNADVTYRIRLLLKSAMYILPEESKQTPLGPYNSAKVAKPLSPLKPAVPLPATVVIMLVTAFTLRTLL